MASSHSVNWHLDILPRATKKALECLSKMSWLRQSKWYLAGGTTLALYEGHRQSVDLDFFTEETNFSPQELIKHFSKKTWETEIFREGTIYGKLLGAKISFISYPSFIPKKPYHWLGNVRLLDPDDIAVMKVIAISQRGRKRDFIDLFWYCTRRKPLMEIIRCLPEQYPSVAHNYHHILKSLTYFADAENDVMPKKKFKTNWKSIKKYFQEEVPKAAHAFLKLRD